MTEQRYRDGNQRQLRRLLSLLPSSSKEHAALIASKISVLLTDEDLIKETIITAGCGMRHSSWNVRSALSSCLEEASRRCLIATSSCVSQKTVSLKALERAWLRLDALDIQIVLESGTLLLSRAPAGLLAEVIEASSMDVRLEKQKQQFMQCIGLETTETGEATYYGGVAALLTTDDIKVTLPTPLEEEKEKGMSSRMRNLKRRRQEAESLACSKKGYVCHGDTGVEESSTFNSALKDMVAVTAVLQDKADNGGALPCFESNSTALDILLLVGNDLAFALFNQNWEARHGAALGLTSIVRGLGGWIPDSRWAEDLISRCICVLALDRFGDYSLSSMVAPVRETVAQLLGLVAHALSSDGVSTAFVKLVSLTTCPQWEVRHGGFVGLQALAALEFGSLGATKVVPPKTQTKCQQHQPSSHIWQTMLEVSLKGLTDTVDDVCGGAAKLLRWTLTWVPPASELDSDAAGTKESPVRNEVFRKASKATWKALDGIQRGDYFASSTSDLLQSLEACGDSAISPVSNVNANLKGLLPLWHHPSHSVRCSTGRIVLSNLITLLGENGRNSHVIASRCIWGLQHDPCNESLEICREIASHLGKLSSTFFLRDDNFCIGGVLRLVFLPEGDDGTSSSYPFFNHHSGTSSFLTSSTWAFPVTFSRRMGACRAIVNMFGHENVMNHALDIMLLSENCSLDIEMACQMETAYLLLSECLLAGAKTTDTTETLVVKQLSGSAQNGLEYDKEMSFLRKTFEVANQEALRELLVAGNNVVEDDYNTGGGLDKDGEEGAGLSWETKAAAVKNRILELENLWWRRITCVAVKCSLLALNGGGKEFSAFNVMIRPLMETLKIDPCHGRKEFAAETLSYMVAILSKNAQYPESKPHHATICHKILNNLSCYICSWDTCQKWGGEAALVLILGSCPIWGEDTAQSDPVHRWLRDRLKMVEQTQDDNNNNSVVKGTAATSDGEVMKSLGAASVVLGCGYKRFTNRDKQLQSRLKKQQICIIDNTPLLQDLLRLAQACYESKRQTVATSALNAFLEACESHPERTWTALQKEKSLFNASDPDKARWGAVIFSCSLEAMSRRNEVIGTVVMEALPTVLRGMTDSDAVVRQSLSEVFSKMISLLSAVYVPAVDKNIDEVEQPSSAASSRLYSMAKLGQHANQDGILIAKHLIRGDPLPVMTHNDLPDDLREAMRLGKDGCVVIRPYQWEGIAWLEFLRRVGAHGILADDMGLGKTLQSLISIALAWCSNRTEHGGLPSFSSNSRCCNASPPALVVCPTTLVSHWANESKVRFGDWIKVVPVIGNLKSRHNAINSIVSGSNMSNGDSRYDSSRLVIVVVSYSALKADVNWFAKQWWGSLVFDEAHLLRNPGTKLHSAARQLRSNHRIALTGTPVQNSALELWSIFEFTMPGYLGDKSEFRSKYVTPIRAAFKSGSDIQCALDGIASLDILHKKVLPFVLRREKGSVLSELPPKVIIDIFCDLTPYQVKLHNALTRTSVAKEIAARFASSESANGQMIPKVMMKSGSSALRWLSAVQRLCIHPALALPDNHPDRPRLLKDAHASSKLTCLRQLLWDCGIGLSDYVKAGSSMGCDNEEVRIGNEDDGGEVAPLFDNSPSLCHGKVLVFSQCKATLDVVEMCLLKPQLPSVHFVRLDGSMTPAQRDKAVTSFQEDPDVTLILITKRVGGVGLNLTAASAIIFLEHDWNPMTDLQAMDRAHRLGQRHCLMVYRIIARQSIEERIMALQSLKVKAAETIINTDNSSLCAMNTNEVINLLSATYPGEGGGSNKRKDAADSGTVDIFASPDWESSDYDYLDMENFVSMFATETCNDATSIVPK